MKRPCPAPASAARASRRAIDARARAGMTLIEILVSIAIIALISGSVALGMGALPRTRLRQSALRLSSTFRWAYVHALTTGRTTRVSFPVRAPVTVQLTVEDTDAAHTLDARDPLRGGGAADVEVDARQLARLMADLRPRAPRASFTRVSDRTFHPRPLESGIIVMRLYSQHDAEPREEGIGHVYFFAGGQAERAVVHLRNNVGEIYSVVLNGLTGRTEVFDRPIEPPAFEDRDRTDQQEIDRRTQPLEAPRR